MDTQVDEEETEEGEYEANTRINTKVPTVIEIKKALKELRNGKAAVATIPEVMKVGVDITANMLHPLFEKIWMEGCILPPTVFLMVIDAVMRNVNRDRRRGIQWALVNRLQDLDFADDLCLLSESHGDMQTKLEDLTNRAEKAGLIISVEKTKALRINTSKTGPFTLRDESIEDVDQWRTQEFCSEGG